MWGQMQIVVFHSFAYTCCTASFQPFCGMSVIRFSMLNDRVFPQVCYRTLAEYKVSGFLGISVVCGGIFCAPIIYGTRFVGNSVTKLNYSLEKVFVYINGTLLFGERPLYPIGYNSAFYINIIPEIV